MLNKNQHCVLYFGVNDNGDVIGQQIGNRTLRDVSQAISVNIEPCETQETRTYWKSWKGWYGKIHSRDDRSGHFKPNIKSMKYADEAFGKLSKEIFVKNFNGGKK